MAGKQLKALKAPLKLFFRFKLRSFDDDNFLNQTRLIKKQWNQHQSIFYWVHVLIIKKAFETEKYFFSESDFSCPILILLWKFYEMGCEKG